jgi:hypothetical protein
MLINMTFTGRGPCAAALAGPVVLPKAKQSKKRRRWHTTGDGIV